MATLSAHDVARELRRRLPNAGVVQIHKLLYYCQGWFATWAKRPLFRERIEAWTNGPVVAEIWADEKHERPMPAETAVAEDGLAVIEYVVDRYGRLPGQELIRLTHQEGPWRDASETEDPNAARNPEITIEALQEWFSVDSDFVAHEKEVARHRARGDVYGLRPRPMKPHERDALAQAMAGAQVRDTRPG